MDKKEIWNLRLFCAVVVMCLVLLVCLAADKPSQAELTVLAYAQENRIAVSEYPQALIDLLERNPETEEFVLLYPLRQEEKTDLSSVDLRRGVPLLMQWDRRWGYLEYGGSMAGITGAAPLCLAMAGYYLTGEAVFYPDNVIRFAADNGYSGASLITEGATALGLSVKEVSAVEDKVATYMQAGNLVIAAMGPGDFTVSSHFIVLTGYEDGRVTVNDPDSYVNSGKEWNFAELKGQIKNLWVIQNDIVPLE